MIIQSVNETKLSSFLAKNPRSYSLILIAGPKSYRDSRETGSWAPNELNDLPEAPFEEFPFILIGKWTMTFLTGQSWHVLKSWYTGEGLERGFRRCFAEGLSQSQLHLQRRLGMPLNNHLSKK